MSGGFHNGAVMNRRNEPPDSLDYYPTPPWATRAFLAEFLCPRLIHRREGVSASDPACGEGHMAHVLKEFFADVTASDVFPYGYGTQADFLHDEVPPAHWIITNPPFNRAADFVRRALDGDRPPAQLGLAMLLRLNWLQGLERQSLFNDLPPAMLAIHHDRVPMHKGRWEPAGSTMTAYCWVIWTQEHISRWRDKRAQGAWRAVALPTIPTGFIEQGARDRHMTQADIDQFGHRTAAPLLEPAS